MLARMDIRSHRITAFAEDPQHYESTSTYLAGGVEEESEGEATPEEVLGDENVLSELAALDFSEEQAAFVFAIMENRMPHRRRTWKKNKRFNAVLRMDRSSVTASTTPKALAFVVKLGKLGTGQEPPRIS